MVKLKNRVFPKLLVHFLTLSNARSDNNDYATELFLLLLLYLKDIGDLFTTPLCMVLMMISLSSWDRSLTARATWQWGPRSTVLLSGVYGSNRLPFPSSRPAETKWCVGNDFPSPFSVQTSHFGTLMISFQTSQDLPLMNTSWLAYSIHLLKVNPKQPPRMTFLMAGKPEF